MPAFGIAICRFVEGIDALSPSRWRTTCPLPAGGKD